MKLGKYSFAVASAVIALNAKADIYNTGYSVTPTSPGHYVDNLWTVTALSSTPVAFPSPPFPAIVLPNSVVTWPWDLSMPAGPNANSAPTLWDSNADPAFAGVDTTGMTTTYTLNFTPPISGTFTLYFECDNYLDMYMGSVSPGNLFYSEQPSHNGTDFLAWQSVPVNVLGGVNNQLNIVVYNFPQTPNQNYTGLRVNFQVPVPEPSTFALAAGGLAMLLAFKRRK